MIVTSVQDGWEVIFQPAHGLLAGALAEQFDKQWRTCHWYETRAAIIGHDDQKMAFEPGGRTYLTDLGAPRDFTLVPMTATQRYREVRDRLDNAYRKHRWIGLLESRHAQFLYGETDISESLDDLLADEQQRRARSLRELEIAHDALEAAYEAMRWCDRCSLILCQNRIPAMGRRLEIVTFADGTRFDIRRDEESGCVTIEPWPFAATEFSVSVEVHQLPHLAFADDVELQQKLETYPPELRAWKFRHPDTVPAISP